MKKNIITTITLLITMVMGMQAAEELFIGGQEVKISSGKTGSITVSGGDIKSGTVTYNYDTKTLTLSNVTITRKGDNKRGIRSSVKNIIVKFYGTNTITTTSAAGLRFEANATVNGYGTLTVNSNETALYAGANTTVTIEGSRSGNYDRLTVNLSGQYGMAGESSSSGGSVTVAGLTAMTASGTSNALCDLKGFTVTSTLGVTLKGNKSNPTVKNLGSAVIHVESPVGAAFQKDKKTICLSGSTSGYTGDIVLRPLMINETNFPDANFRKFLTGYTYGPKGYYTDDELIQIKEITVNKMDIASLKGIEFFTKLIALKCSNNKLTEMDLSKNTALEVLICDGNQLTKLDLSKNTALGVLECEKNQLTKLDLSNNPKLRSLSCQKNQLTSLILPEGYSLEDVDCSENKLKTLDISKNCGSLLALYCYDNQLTTLDTSMGGPTIHLHCYNNQLSTLTFSKYLTELKCSNNKLTKLEFPNESRLIGLECANNQLTTLDVEKLKDLKTLDCKNNKIATLNLYTYGLESLDCSNNELTTLDLENNLTLSELYCNDNQLPELNVKYFNIKILFCHHNKIRGTEMDNFIFSLPKGYGSLRVFYDDAKEGNVCTKAQVAAIKEKQWTVFYYNTAKEDWLLYEGSDPAIDIDEKNFPDVNFRNFLLNEDYGKDGELTTREIAALTTMNVSSQGIKSLKGIEYFTALTELDCSNNQLSKLDLSKNTKLKNLYCDNNQLTALDLSKNTALTRLYCYNNQLTALDVSKNTALTDLDCHSNQLTALDVSKNTALTELYCSWNQLTKLSCYINRLTALDLSQNTALTTLYCDYNKLTALDVSKNTALTVLYCGNNQIKGAQMDALVNSLPTVASGKLYVFDSSSDTEQNVCTMAQVATAKKKGWTVYYDSGTSGWQVYEGFNDVLKGDANGDGKIDIVDVTSTISYILGQNPATFNKEAADVNGDNKVDIVDVTTIIDIILGK